MAKPILPDELWSILEPLLPAHTPSPKGGRPRIDDRAALTGILFVLRTGIPWEYLPRELGCGAGMSCWRRLRDWQQTGIWQKLHEAMLHRLRESDQLEWERASIDSASMPSPPPRGQQYWTKPYRSRQARLQASHHRRQAGTYHWWHRSRGRTFMIRACCNRWSPRCHRFPACLDAPASVRRNCMATKATITDAIESGCVTAASPCGLPGAGSNRMSALENGAGYSNALSVGSIVSDACVFGMSGAVISIRHSSRWLARSSACDSWNGFVRRS